MKKNNKGFSYVEMIIVIAIMALMVGMITLSIGMVNRNNVSRAGDKLATMIDKARVSAMTKGPKKGFLNIALVDGAVYAAVGEQMFTATDVKTKGEKICNDKIIVDVRVPNNPLNLGAGFHSEYASDVSVGVFSLEFTQVSGGLKDHLRRNVVLRDGPLAEDGTMPSGRKWTAFNILELTGNVIKD